LTSDQLVQARAERMRQNGLGTLSLEEARTWIEETGLSLFLPRKQFSSSVAPSFVEAVAGRPEATPDPKTITLAEELLVRLENEGVAVRLNLMGQPGEQPDFVVAAWVLPYVYALRGDRDWRRSPQLTGSRQVSQLAVHVYKQLEGGDQTVSQLKQALGREVSEAAVVRAITELWQQLRIIPVIATRGQAAKWQLLRTRFQRAIAEGASTSQVTAISVLASIYLQAVIAASMEDVELFLAPLTARSKIREVIRGLVATRQVHTISLGHAPHFYVAGTLPEFEPVSTLYASATMPASAYFTRSLDRDEETHSPVISVPFAQRTVPYQPRPSEPAPAPVEKVKAESPAAKPPVNHASTNGKHETTRSRFSRPVGRKPAAPSRPAQSSSSGHAKRSGSEARPTSSRARSSSGARWTGSKNRKQATAGNASHAAGSHPRSSNGNGSHRNGKSAAQSWTKHSGSTKAKPAASRKEAHPARKSRPALTSVGRAGASGKRFFGNRSKSRTGQGTKKRG
jgi:hypothetical protein